MEVHTALKQARESKRLTLEDVARETKISPRILQQMEAGAYEKLPGELYAKSFLKQYTQFLKIDTEAILEQYQQRSYEASRGRGKGSYQNSQERKRNKKVIPLFFSVAGIVFILFVVTRATALWREKVEELKKASVSAFPNAIVGGPTTLLISREAPLEVMIRAVEPTWMQVRVDDLIVFQNVLAKNNYEVWRPKQQVEVWLSNAGGVEVLLNKQLLGSPGKKGQVMKGIVLSREGMRIP